MPTPLLGNLKRGLVFVVSAPAGTGKTTLVDILLNEFPNEIQRSISYTTRSPRVGEQDGVHYHFIPIDEFEKRKKANEFLEYVELFGNYYGTSKKAVEEQLNLGKHVILVIDTQGAVKLKKKIKAINIFIKPPSQEILKERLTLRQTENDENIEKRLSWAQHELELIKEYDYLIINDELKTAYDALRSIIIAEEHKTY